MQLRYVRRELMLGASKYKRKCHYVAAVTSYFVSSVVRFVGSFHQIRRELECFLSSFSSRVRLQFLCAISVLSIDRLTLITRS